MRPLPFVFSHRIAAIGFLIASSFFADTSLHSSLSAQEPSENFLRALREQRFFDVAIDYLEEMKDSPLAPLEFRERIALFKVDVMLDEAGTFRDEAKLSTQLTEIEGVLKEFIATNPRPSLLAEAEEQRAGVYMISARRLLRKADSDRATAAQKTEYQTEARSYLEKAGQAYESIRLRMRTELKKPLDVQDPNANARRKSMRNRYVMVRYNSPKIKERIADSYGKDHPRYKKLLEEAVAESLDLQQKYRGNEYGVEGFVSAARCLQKLGETDRALSYLDEVFSQGRGFATQKRAAALVAIEAWKSKDPFPALDAYAKLRVVAKTLPGDFARTADGILIQMTFAEAGHALADKIKDGDGPADGTERQRMVNLERESTKVMRALVRIPGAHRKQAQELLAKWGNSVTIDEPKADTGPPETLAEAQERAKSIQLNVSQFVSELDAKEKLLAGGDTSQQAAVAALQEKVETSSQAAMDMLTLALTMTDEKTGGDDLSNIRYLQCANYYQKGDYFEAAIIGEFLLEKFPNNSGTKPASTLVCKAYWNMYRESRTREGADGDRSFEREQLTKNCEYVFKTYPDSRQSEQAGLLMTLLALSEGDAVAAERYLNMVPADSPARSGIVLEVGTRLWASYVKGKKDQLDEGELLARRGQAEKLLADGVASLSPKKLTLFQARSALSLTELYLDAGKTDQAIEQLETARVAPLDLLKTKHPTTQDPAFRRNIYKTSIRAYLAKLRDGTETLKWVEKSQGVLSALKAETGDSPAAQKQLSNIYLTLARELKQQFETLENNEQRAAFADGLETFLTALSESAEEKNLKLLTGSMLTKIGLGLQNNQLNDRAKRFFAQAVTVYEGLDPAKEGDPRVKLEILRGRANSLRGSGQYEKAIKQFGDILSDPTNRRYIDLQVDASATYTEWGLATNNPDIFLRATKGGEPRKGKGGGEANTIMGWVNLAKSAQRNKKNELVAEAIYNIALCKFRYGVVKNRTDLQDGAIREIQRFRERVPAMGGAAWKQKLDELDAQLKREKRAP